MGFVCFLNENTAKVTLRKPALAKIHTNSLRYSMFPDTLSRTILGTNALHRDRTIMVATSMIRKTVM